MTEQEYQALRRTLIQGCMPERRNFIDQLRNSPARLFEFTERLQLASNVPSQLETWRFLAQVCAIVGSDYVARIDGPVEAEAVCV